MSPNMMKLQIIYSYLSSFTGGWIPYLPERPVFNQIIQLYIWILFATIPVIARLLIQSPIIAGSICFILVFSLVLFLKTACYQLHKIFDTREPKVLEVPELKPSWVGLTEYLKHPVQSTERPLADVANVEQSFSRNYSQITVEPEMRLRNLGPYVLRPQENVSIQGQLLENPTESVPSSQMQLPSCKASVEVNLSHDLNQIDENDELNIEQKNETKFDPSEKDPIIKMPCSLDTGLDEIRRLERCKAVRRKISFSHPRIDHYQNKDCQEVQDRLEQYGERDILADEKAEEIKPLTAFVQSVDEIEHDMSDDIGVFRTRVRLVCRANKIERKQDTSTSCTIRKNSHHCQSDPERLSVSDNKLQVGELTENLKRTQGRCSHLNRTLKSVLSESSVADPAHLSKNDARDCPKSAENVNQSQELLGLRKKEKPSDSVELNDNQEEHLIEQMVEKWGTDILRLQQNTSVGSECSSGKRSPSACDTLSFSSNQATNGDISRRRIPRPFVYSRHWNNNQAPPNDIEMTIESTVLKLVSMTSHDTWLDEDLPTIVKEVLRTTQSRPRDGNSSQTNAPTTSAAFLDVDSYIPSTDYFPAQSLPRSVSSSEPTAEIRPSTAIELASNTGHAPTIRTILSSNVPKDLLFFHDKLQSGKFQYYDVDFMGATIKLFYTPLQMNELMHETKSVPEIFMAATMAGLASCCASSLSFTKRPIDIFGNLTGSLVFGNISFVALFLVSASAQYSLIKSPVPDTASPVHGYSRSMAYARSVYLVLLSLILFVLLYISSVLNEPVTFYGFQIFTDRSVAVFIEVFKWMVLLIPLFFAMGLYPQIKTLFNFILEQIEFHIFGGSGSSGISSSMYSLARSMISFALLFPILYYACKGNEVCMYFYLPLSVAFCYQLSRQTNSNPMFDWYALKSMLGFTSDSDVCLPDTVNKSTVHARLETSLVISVVQFVIFFLVTAFSVFDVANQTKPLLTAFNEDIGCFSLVMVCLTTFNGIVIHYLVPRMRQLNPWGLFKAPFLRNSEWRRFEATSKSSKILWFEKLVIFAELVEKNVIYPLAILNETWIGFHSDYFKEWTPAPKSFVLGFSSFRLLRQNFRTTHYQWLVLLCSHLLKYDMRVMKYKEPVILTWFLGNIVYSKILGFYQRLGFVYVQLNPGTTWGSAFHAVAQPLSMPHSGWLFAQTLISTLTSAPLKPLGGSTIFMTSYIRTFRFWEKNYNTKLDDNIRLQSQLEYHRKKDENGNKNALFYENLAFSLKKHLAGDIQLGRYGNVREGDVFILASSSTSDSQQNGLIQIVEISNGVVSFQFRGLEFKGTYCQQREVEAITEDSNVGCVCCAPRSLAEVAGCGQSNPFCLSFGSWIRNLAMTWRVLQKNYVLDGYSICDSSASNLFSIFDYRKQVITYFVKCIIYYAIKTDNSSFGEIIKQLKNIKPVAPDNDEFLEANHAFHVFTDIDYDFNSGGVKRTSFIASYFSWISFVYNKFKNAEIDEQSDVVTLCFALSLMGRKALASAAHQGPGLQDPVRLELFLHGLHSLFQGNIMPDPSDDDWIYIDMDLLKEVIAPSIRLAIKLQHDEHRVLFTLENTRTNAQTWSDITEVNMKTVICHENDPKWRASILGNEPELFSFRHVLDDEQGSDYRILMLIHRQLSFKIIRINPESVRGLWAAQQEELIFIRNQNTERGSIQNSRPVLRNVINSSCDQPIGYPTYVSPILTSYASEHSLLPSIVGRDLCLYDMLTSIFRFFGDCIATCISCNSGFGIPDDVFGGSIPLGTMTRSIQTRSAPVPNEPPQSRNYATSTINDPTLTRQSESSDSEESIVSIFAQDNLQIAEIIDENQVLSNLDGLRRGGPQLVHWDDPEWRDAGGSRSWGSWRPKTGDIGLIVWGWYPCHRQREKRSHIHTPILLLEVQDNSEQFKYVPVQKPGIKLVPRATDQT